jgi:hypothetical protein
VNTIFDDHPAGQAGAACNVNVIADEAVVLDNRAGVDDRIHADAHTGVHNGSGQNLCAVADRGAWRHGRSRMDDR